MKILVAHNSYQQRGGEDLVFEVETALLEKAGHSVRRFLVNNDHISGIAGKLSAAVSMLNNRASVSSLLSSIDDFKPEIVHFHNFFPTLSPAAVAAVAKRGIPVVQTLHNYRLLCAGAMLLRDGKVCEDCLGGSSLPGVIHRCYRSSAVGSALVGRMGEYFKAILRKYGNQITLIALTEFAKSRFVADGYDPSRIVVRGNVLPDKGFIPRERANKIVFVGRLSAEKGVDTLIKAAFSVNAAIEIIGDGPLRKELEAMAPNNVKFLGHLDSAQVLEHMQTATALAVPSRWYEGFPMVVLEAMATGTPVVASRIGSLAEVVIDGKTGKLVDLQDTAGWSRTLSELLSNDTLAANLGQGARQRFLDHHSEMTGISTLNKIYADIMR